MGMFFHPILIVATTLSSSFLPTVSISLQEKGLDSNTVTVTLLRETIISFLLQEVGWDLVKQLRVDTAQ